MCLDLDKTMTSIVPGSSSGSSSGSLGPLGGPVDDICPLLSHNDVIEKVLLSIAPKPPEACKFFLQGRCRSGSKCPFKHTDNKTSKK